MFMKILKKLNRFSNILIIGHMILLPYNGVALAESKDSEPGFFSWNTLEKYMPAGLSFVQGFTQSILQANQPQQQDQYNAFKQNFDQKFALKQVDPRTVPGGPIFSGCVVVNAQMNRLSGAERCMEVDDNTALTGYSAALMDTMEFNINQVDKMLTKGNNKFADDGVGCYEKKMSDFDTLLKSRELQIDKYIAKLQELLDDFNQNNKAELDSIRRMTALLDGTNNEKYMKDAKFDVFFLGANDQGNVCGSIISATELNREGKKNQNGGLRAIEELLSRRTNDPQSSGPGAKSALEIASSKEQLQKEVRQLGNKISRNFESSGKNQISRGLSEISHNGTLIEKDNKAIERVIGNFNLEMKNKFENLMSDMEVETKIEGIPELAAEFNNISTKRVNFDDLESRLDTISNRIKKDCLRNAIRTSGFGSIENFVGKFRLPGVSKSLNNEGDNPLATEILRSFNENEDIGEFMKEVISAQKGGVNSRYIMTTGKTVKIGNTTINASTPLPPSRLLSIFAGSCQRNYKAKMAGNKSGYSAADAIEAIKDYASQKENIRRTAASNIANKITKELLTCPSNGTTGKTSQSCNGAMDLNSDKFCVRTAHLCATNTIGCYEKAKAQVKSIRRQQVQKAANYSQNVNNFKMGMARELKQLNNFMEAQARSLDQQVDLGTTFGVPKIELKLSKRAYLHEKQGSDLPDESLFLEDPEEYLKDNVASLNNLKKELEAQRIEMLGNNAKGGKLGEVAKQFENSLKTVKKDAQAVYDECKQKFAQAGQRYKENQEKIAEGNKKTQQACQELRAFNNNPEAIEHEELAKTLGDVVQIAAAIPGQTGDFVRFNNAADQATIAQIRAFNSKCDEDAESAGLFGTSDGRLSADNICEKENRIKVADLFSLSDEKIQKICDSSTDGSSTRTCDKKTFQKRVRESGWNFCIATETGRLHAWRKNAPTECLGPIENSKEKKVKTPLKKGDYDEYAEEMITAIEDSDETGKQIKCIYRDEEDAKSQLEVLATSYNCQLVRKQAGQLRVSFCSLPVNGQVNNKGDAIQNLMNAFGQGVGAFSN